MIRASVIEKIREETDEIEAALETGDSAAIAGEIGDLLFSAANLARHVKADPEAAIRQANAKFERRFRYIEEALAARWLGGLHCRIGGDGSALEYRQVSGGKSSQPVRSSGSHSHTTEAAFAKAVKAVRRIEAHPSHAHLVAEARNFRRSGSARPAVLARAHERCRPTPYFCA